VPDLVFPKKKAGCIEGAGVEVGPASKTEMIYREFIFHSTQTFINIHSDLQQFPQNSRSVDDTQRPKILYFCTNKNYETKH
jgi:hypothetical protein